MDDETDLDQLSEPAKAETTRGMTPEEKAIAIAASGKLIWRGVLDTVPYAFIASVAVGLTCHEFTDGSLVMAIGGIVMAAGGYLAATVSLVDWGRLWRSLRTDIAEGVVVEVRGVARRDAVLVDFEIRGVAGIDAVTSADGDRYHYVRVPDVLPPPGTPVECVVARRSQVILRIRAITSNERCDCLRGGAEQGQSIPAGEGREPHRDTTRSGADHVWETTERSRVAAGDEEDLDQLSAPAEVATVRGMTPQEKAIATTASGKLIRKAVFDTVTYIVLASVGLGLTVLGPGGGNAVEVIWWVLVAASGSLTVAVILGGWVELWRRVHTDLAEGVVLEVRGEARKDEVRSEQGDLCRHVRVAGVLPPRGTPVECVVARRSGVILSVRAIASPEHRG